ncbi:Gfo/Idh/MocA family protein [Hippea alviniae]|uniref:Gfo/Idh/MocA family protein n=1 Tax=Hippea alviniae TaxID=1279027 RepID=UPI0003B59985|nr:Gfo/Idh/MocA family oxidoreductase [Hippea alviniae]
MDKIKLMIIGIGPHAQTIHIPILAEIKNKIPLEITLAIDINERIDEIKQWFDSQNIKPKSIRSVEFFAHDMPKETENYLDKLIEKEEIDGVIISTPPYCHKAYALWALKHKLHILMDKPISTYLNVINDEEKAKAIYDDYLEILKAYKELQKTKKTAFMIHLKRRYHLGFFKVLDYLDEISQRFNIPITSMHVYNADGKWRLPHELITHNYHPYNTGCGMISHTGYHLIDAAWWLFEKTCPKEKFPQKIEVFSSFLTPTGLIHQLNYKDYLNIFGEEYKKEALWNDEFLKIMTKPFGEVDAFVIIRLIKDNEIISHITLNIQHNTFSKRSWIKSKKDLLKGNGRVHHESFNIHQGPLQNIQIHSYHAYDRHTKEGNHFNVGGTQHFDIYRFLNIGITHGKSPIIVESAEKLTKENNLNITLSQHSKKSVIIEFLNLIKNPDRISESSIEKHKTQVKIMSAIYLSHIKQKQGENPIIEIEI